MKFHEEFKLVENLWEDKNVRLVESTRSIEEIKAEIAKLERELHKAEVAAKKAAYDSAPTELYIWDMYVDPSEKGTFTSAELYDGKWDGTVFETEDDAIDSGFYHLQELDLENELDGYDVDEYTIEAIAIPFAEVSKDALIHSDLEHLI